MAITKETVVDQVTVTENGIVLYREATRIIEDGKVLTQTYHRTSLTPGQDYSAEEPRVQAVCSAVHTAECIAAYEAQKAANRLGA